MQEDELSAGGIIKWNKHRKISLVYHGFVYVSLTVWYILAAVLPWGPPQFCRSVTMTSTIIILPQVYSVQSLEENTADLLHKLNLVLEICQSFLLWYVKNELYTKFYIMLLQMLHELFNFVFLKVGWPTNSYFFIIDSVLISLELLAEPLVLYQYR